MIAIAIGADSAKFHSAELEERNLESLGNYLGGPKRKPSGPPAIIPKAEGLRHSSEIILLTHDLSSVSTDSSKRWVLSCRILDLDS